MKRTKQTTTIIETVNTYLKNNHIQDTSDPAFSTLTHALIQAKTYRGYNLYTAEGKLSGGVNTDYIQIY